MKIAFTLLILFCTVGFPVLARDYIPELDEQESADVTEFVNPRAKFAEEDKLRRIGLRFQDKALRAENKGEFEQAFENWMQQSKFNRASCIRTNAARCLDKVGRRQEALVMVQRVLEHSKDTDAFRLKIGIENELGKFDEALKTCRQYRARFELDGDSPVVESTVFLAMGDKERAVKSAREAYFYCARNSIPTDKAIAQLKNLNESVPLSIPYSKVDNEKVFANLKLFRECPRHLSKKEVKTLFTISSGYILDGSPFHSRKPRFFSDLSYQLTSLSPGDVRDYDFLRVALNGDRCAITRADVEEKLGVPESGIASSEKSAPLEYKGVINKLVLAFDDSSGYLRGYEVQTPSQQKTPMRAPKQPDPPSLEQIKLDLAQSRWRLAAHKLMWHWEYYLGNERGEVGYKRYLKLKQLLIQAYRGLELDEIARYIERAPHPYLWADINKANIYGELPTSAEYAFHKWTVSGYAPDPQHGYYNVYISGYGMVSFTDKSRYFKDVYQLVGSKYADRLPISVLPCEWLDSEFFQLK